MQEKGRVIFIDGDVVTLVPQDIDVCINCANTVCKKNGHKFTALNSRHFDIKAGMAVTVAAPVRSIICQTIAGVLLPFVGASASYIVSSRIWFSQNQAVAGGVSVGIFFLWCGIFAILSRKNTISRLPVITGII